MQGNYNDAKPLYERSLRIQEVHLGDHHPDIATSLNNLALLLMDQVICAPGRDYSVATNSGQL